MITTKTTSPTSVITQQLGEVIKLGIDVHASSYVVVMKIDSSSPLRSKQFSPEAFIKWVTTLRSQCRELHSCYEAGPFGYGLHRKLTAMGINNFVIRPINWDTHGQNVKTDSRDATQMALALDGYLRGNDRSFSARRVPGEEEERKRSLTRQRQSLIKERTRMTRCGRSHGLYYGESVPASWWKPRNWNRLTEQLSDHLLDLLEPLRALCVHLDEQIQQLEAKMAQQIAPEIRLPKGMGVVIFEQMEREVCDWSRFSNRKQVGSFTGLCPSEDTSAKRRFQGSINKHGNARLRHILIECAWQLIRWNPNYHAVAKWREQLESAKATRSSRKKVVVAIARQFAVDWWRIRTGVCTPQSLGLQMKEPV